MRIKRAVGLIGTLPQDEVLSKPQQATAGSRSMCSAMRAHCSSIAALRSGALNEAGSQGDRRDRGLMEKDESAPDNWSAPSSRSFAVPITTGWSGEQRRSSQDYFGGSVLGNSRPPAPHITIPSIPTTQMRMTADSLQAISPKAEQHTGSPGSEGPGVGISGTWGAPQFSMPSIETLQRPIALDVNYPMPPMSAFEVGLIEDSRGVYAARGASADDGSESEPEAEGSESPKRQKGVKKKVGRPIAYKGDPNNPNLTEAERRRIKRRVANRESARRVRNRRQEQLEEAKAQMVELSATNRQLLKHAQAALADRNALSARLVELEAKLNSTLTENRNLQQEMQALKGSLKVSMEKLEMELDKQAEKELPNDLQMPTHSSAVTSEQLPPDSALSASTFSPGIAVYSLPTHESAFSCKPDEAQLHPRVSAFSSRASEPFTSKDESWEGRGLDTSQQEKDMSLDVLNLLPSLNLSPLPSRVDDLFFGSALVRDSPFPAAKPGQS